MYLQRFFYVWKGKEGRGEPCMFLCRKTTIGLNRPIVISVYMDLLSADRCFNFRRKDCRSRYRRSASPDHCQILQLYSCFRPIRQG